MKSEEVLDLIKHGENSSVEFKRDEISSESLAKEMVAMTNLAGGKILLGVADNREIVGLSRSDVEEWVMNIARQNIFPPILPHFEILEDFKEEKKIAIVSIPVSPAKPCRVIHKNRKTVYIRVGSTVREPSDEELLQMLQANQRLNYGKILLTETTLEDIYFKRTKQYLETNLRLGLGNSDKDILQTLENLELIASHNGEYVSTINGILLFGKTPKKHLFQAGIRAVVYRETLENYDIVEDSTLDDPLVPEIDENGRVMEYGLIERAIHFIGKHCPSKTALTGARNIETSEFSNVLLRELIVNSLVHRDYTIAGADILLSIFPDRLEIKTPGRLPNGATIEALKKGFRYYRNQTLVNVLRDYGYIDARGMGIRLKIIPSALELTGKEPTFIATDTDFTVIIFRP